MKIVLGEITKWRENNTVEIVAPIPNIEEAIRKKYKNVEVGFCDGRSITPAQRRKAFSILGEIAEWAGCSKEYIHNQLKLEFIVHRQQSLGIKIFSMSNCSETVACEYIQYLIDFCIEWEVPTKEPLFTLAEDIQRYVYVCTLKKSCCVCGRLGELHHVDRVGAGRNRETINHLGMKALCLCRKHHTEIHDKGERDFLAMYHLEPVKIDEKIARVYKLNRKGKNEL